MQVFGWEQTLVNVSEIAGLMEAIARFGEFVVCVLILWVVIMVVIVIV